MLNSLIVSRPDGSMNDDLVPKINNDSLINYYSSTRIHNLTEDQYKKLFSNIGGFLYNSNYVYKMCQDSKNDWLIILKRVGSSINNEKRTNISNVFTAKYRGTKFEVVKIININDPSKTLKELENTCYESKVIYKIGEIIVPECKYDENLDEVCSSGIHYFVTLFAAAGFRIFPDNFVGKWVKYKDDGREEVSKNYV